MNSFIKTTWILSLDPGYCQVTAISLVAKSENAKCYLTLTSSLTENLFKLLYLKINNYVNQLRS